MEVWLIWITQDIFFWGRLGLRGKRGWWMHNIKGFLSLRKHGTCELLEVWIYQNCAPMRPCLRRGISVWDHWELLHGSVLLTPSVKFKYSNLLWEYRLIFHGKSLWPSVGKDKTPLSMRFNTNIALFKIPTIPPHTLYSMGYMSF